MVKIRSFWDALTYGGVMQGLITLMFCGAWIFLVAQEKKTPVMLDTIVNLIIGFWIRDAVQRIAMKFHTG